MWAEREKPEIHGEVKNLETREYTSTVDSDRRIREEDVLDIFGYGWLYNIQIYTLYGQQEMKDWEKDKGIMLAYDA